MMYSFFPPLIVFRPVLVVQLICKMDLRFVTFLNFTFLAATNRPTNLVIRSVSHPFRQIWSSGFVGQQIWSSVPWHRAMVMTHPPGIDHGRFQSHQFHVIPFIMGFGICLPRGRKNNIPTYLVLDQDPFSDLLNHEAGPRTTNLKNRSEICYFFVFYLPRGNKSPNKSRSKIRQPPISTNLVIRFRFQISD